MKRIRGARAFRLVFAVIGGVVAVASDARAEPTSEEKALATTLFRDAKALLETNHVAEACRKLEESERLDPAGGTLLNLAVCHEREGRTASAWAEFREARVRADHDQRGDRAELADAHLRALSLRLSKLVISVPPEVDVPDLTITIDGHAVGRAAWGTAMPVDPEAHVVIANAPGMKAWNARVEIAPDVALKTVTLPPWKKMEAPPPQAPPPSTPNPQPTPIVRVEPQVEKPSPPPESFVSRHGSALIAGGVGLVGIGMGSYFGGLAISSHNRSVSACTTNPCGAASTSYNNWAKTAADTSTVSFSVGLVALAVGTYLWFSHGSEAAVAPPVSIAPAVGPGRASLDLAGHF